MSSQDDELERLRRLRERQIQARDPKAKDRKVQASVTARRRKLKKSVSFQTMMRDVLGDMPYKLWGALIGVALGTVISIVLALFLEDIVMVAIIGLAATIVLAVVGVIFGHSFDWRAEVEDEFKNL